MEISASITLFPRQKSVSFRLRNCPHCGQKYLPWRTESARAFSCCIFDPSVHLTVWQIAEAIRFAHRATRPRHAVFCR